MSAAKICPQCNNEYPLDQRFCPIDGSTLKSQGGAGDLVGSVVADRYYVLRKLGEGGMGQVYLAEHVRMGRKSALKVMHPAMVQDADAISRFNREAANASRISHPNVAAIYDFGETGDGLIYLAMEYVDGEPLTALVERSGALPPLRAADIIRQAADALSVAHDMGIVHRDLKPDNIMLTKNRDGSDCVKVVDFGIAKAEGSSQKVTKTGLVVGTPEYMSPEQLAGDKLDGRSDIYSLGIVAFHLLTGKLPFPSDSAQESMIMRLTDRPRRLDEMRAEVQWPAELQAVMDRVLERQAAARYASAAEFGRDLARAVERMPESAMMTAGTAVIGAVDVPATRVGDAAGGGRAPSALGASAGGGRAAQTAAATAVLGAGGAPDARRPTPDAVRGPAGPRTAILIAAGVLLVLGGGAAAVQLMGGDATPGASDSLAASNAIAPSKTDVVTRSDSSAIPPTAEQFAKAVPQPGTGSPAGRSEGEIGTPGPRAGAPAVDRPAPSDVAAALRQVETLTERAAVREDGDAARQAISELNQISRRLVKGSEDHIWAQLLRAEAHAALDEGEQMCSVLGTIESRPDDATKHRRIETLRRACP